MSWLTKLLIIPAHLLLLLHNELLAAGCSPLSPPQPVQPLTDPGQTEAEALSVQPWLPLLQLWGGPGGRGVFRCADGRPAASAGKHSRLRPHAGRKWIAEVSGGETERYGWVGKFDYSDQNYPQPSGAWSLEISHNKLNSIPSLAFSGLERSLWRLVLNSNMFTRIPSDSISRLEKLNHLDLSGQYLFHQFGDGKHFALNSVNIKDINRMRMQN